jgi:hypothetical protein
MTEGFRSQVGEFQTMPSLPDPTKTPGTPWTDAGHINFLENEVNNQKVPSSERNFGASRNVRNKLTLIVYLLFAQSRTNEAVNALLMKEARTRAPLLSPSQIY